MADPHVGIMKGFSAVDAAAELAQFVAYLDEADRAPLILEIRQRITDILGPRPGDAVIDVGCGTGTALFALAEVLGRDGRAVGVDSSEGMIAVAEQRKPRSVEVACASATALPFADDAFDAYRAERVYQHLDDPKLALVEARRVLRPGGRIVLAEPDWGGLLLDEPEPLLLPKALTAICARAGARVGRTLRRLLLEENFDDVEIEAITSTVTTFALADRLILMPLLAQALALGALEAAEVAALRQGLAEQDERGSFFLSVPTFVASGVSP